MNTTDPHNNRHN
jgi:uncharacterized membrane protein YdjX (TVP38/TMEM64 family)